MLRGGGVNRVIARRACHRSRCSSARSGPDDVRRAVHTLRDAGFDNVSLDLLYGIPGESPADLEADLADALALEPEHLSATSSRRSPAHASRTRTGTPSAMPTRSRGTIAGSTR